MLRSPLRQYARAIHHFAVQRTPEVLALQASPFLGAVLGNFGGDHLDLGRIALLLAGSIALTAHIFVLNDWAGQSSDRNDPRRARRVFGWRGVSSRQVAHLAVGLLVVATAALALLVTGAVLLGATIAGLSVLYSCSRCFGKGTPIVGSLIHLLGGALHFLLGYTVSRPVDERGVAIAVFFGLVFAGGHLNQEVRDHDADVYNGIRTNAVVFGCRRTFLGSLLVFTAAYATLATLAVVAFLPRPLVAGVFLWPCQVACSFRALRIGSGFDMACWMQRRYRVLFALLGLAMLVTAPPIAELVRQAPSSANPGAIRRSLISNGGASG